MNKARRHLERASELLGFGEFTWDRFPETVKGMVFNNIQNQHSTHNIAPTSKEFSRRVLEARAIRKVLFREDDRNTELSMEEFHGMLRSARGPIEHPQHAHAFVLMCLGYFGKASGKLAKSDSWHLEMNVIRAFEAALMISGMADEGCDFHQTGASANTTGAPATTFQYDGTTYGHLALKSNLAKFNSYNRNWGNGEHRYSQNTINEMIVEIEQELIKLLQTITPEELRQITIKELRYFKSESDIIVKNLQDCSKAYWKATVARQSVRGSAR